MESHRVVRWTTFLGLACAAWLVVDGVRMLCVHGRLGEHIARLENPDVRAAIASEWEAQELGSDPDLDRKVFEDQRAGRVRVRGELLPPIIFCFVAAGLSAAGFALSFKRRRLGAIVAGTSAGAFALLWLVGVLHLPADLPNFLGERCGVLAWTPPVAALVAVACVLLPLPIERWNNRWDERRRPRKPA